jgi:hypothetical protein
MTTTTAWLHGVPLGLTKTTKVGVMPNREASAKAIASGKLVLNAVLCDLCNVVIWSGDRHEFRTCECGNISVDGGLDYLRRVGSQPYTELSIYLDGDNRGRMATA